VAFRAGGFPGRVVLAVTAARGAPGAKARGRGREKARIRGGAGRRGPDGGLARRLLDLAGVAMVALDSGGAVSYVNRSGCRLLGRAESDIVGMDWFGRFVAGREAESCRRQFRDMMAGGCPEYTEFPVITADGGERLVGWHMAALREPSGNIAGMLCTGEDLTDRRRDEDSLRRSEGLFRLLAENAQDMMYRVRLFPRLSVEYVSPSALAITGYAPEEYYADPVLGFGLIPFEGHPETEGAAWAREAFGGPRTMRWRRKDGGAVVLELLNHPVLNAAGRLVAVEGIARDISARKEVEDALRESEEKFRDLAEQSPNMIFINCRGRIVYANRRCEELTGYKREDLYSPDFDFQTLTAPECRAMVSEKYGMHLSGREVAPYAYVLVTKSGTRMETILGTKLINYGGEQAVLGTVTDITERNTSVRALADSEERYRRLFEGSPQGIVTIGLDGHVMDVNPAGLKTLGLDRGEAVGRHFTGLQGAGAADNAGLSESFDRFLRGDRPERLELRIKSPGRDVWQELSPAILEKDGRPWAIQVIMQDITDRKLAEEKMSASLREKEVLLKEIHHRVKNNLQIIQSLLNMQARNVREARVVNALRESQNRVRTMALIHERLYRSTDLSEIDMREYIGRLAAELCQSYGAEAARISLELELGGVRLGIDSAIPCGFIVNELVSNCLKHAFPGDRPGRLRVGLRREPSGPVRLSVRDDGRGLPEGLDFRRTETLGLQLVCTLVDQLGGTIEREPGGGTAFLVTFDPGRAGGA